MPQGTAFCIRHFTFLLVYFLDRSTKGGFLCQNMCAHIVLPNIAKFCSLSIYSPPPLQKSMLSNLDLCQFSYWKIASYYCLILKFFIMSESVHLFVYLRRYLPLCKLPEVLFVCFCLFFYWVFGLFLHKFRNSLLERLYFFLWYKLEIFFPSMLPVLVLYMLGAFLVWHKSCM